MTKREAIKQARANAEKRGTPYVVVRNPYIGGWWVVTAATATINGLTPVFSTEVK